MLITSLLLYSQTITFRRINDPNSMNSTLPTAVPFLLLFSASQVSGDTLDPIQEHVNASPRQLVQAAQRYEHGEGVGKDIDTAIRLYCRAARAGYAVAQYHLGWVYANGRDLKRDDASAAAWFKKAADSGDQHSARMLKRLPTPTASAHCILSSGESYFEPLRTSPNPNPELILKWVQRLAPEYGLDIPLVLAVIRAESNFNPKALSPKNAHGLMQLIPATAKRFGVKDIWDPLQNIRGGMAYLRWLLDNFEGNEKLALAGYNAGENAVLRYRGIPPYAETRNYVRKVSRWRLNTPTFLLHKG